MHRKNATATAAADSALNESVMSRVLTLPGVGHFAMMIATGISVGLFNGESSMVHDLTIVNLIQNQPII